MMNFLNSKYILWYFQYGKKAFVFSYRNFCKLCYRNTVTEIHVYTLYIVNKYIWFSITLQQIIVLQYVLFFSRKNEF